MNILQKIYSNQIIQFGPIRTGSTLVYNLLKELFPERDIVKTHHFRKRLFFHPQTVITYRNPIHSLSSSIIRFDEPINDESIEVQLEHLKSNGLDELIKYFDCHYTLKLKYEDFYENFNYIFNQFEVYFDISIPDLKREELNTKYNVATIKDQEIVKNGNAKEYDSTTHWHGKHVSDNLGKPSAHNVFDTRQLDYIIGVLNPYMEVLGYTKNDL